MNLWQKWNQLQKRDPNRLVLIEAETHRYSTVQQVSKGVEILASNLQEIKGKRIAFCLPNSAAWIIHFLAIQSLKGIAAPLDPTLTRDQQLHLCQQIEVDFLIVEERLLPVARKRSSESGKACCIKITSGSTGVPKLILCQSSHLLADGDNIIRTMKIKKDDRNLAIIPFGHSYGLGNLVMPLIMQGTRIVCLNSFVPYQITSIIQEYGVTVLPTVPAIFRILSEMDDFVPLKGLKLAISAGAPLSAKVAQKFFDKHGVKIHNFYGSSETGGICYDRTGNATLSGRSVGKPLKGVRVTITKTSQVQVKSDAVIGRRYVLPDLGKLNSYRELELVGRAGTIANIAGKKVHPVEIENALRKIPKVSDVWVSVKQQSNRSDVIVAAIESNLSQNHIEKLLSKNLPAWKLPRRYFIQSSLPRTARGKLDIPQIQQMLK
jgi:acyl-coenzyme A synthetase/AMP-(fatty) acid ligase